MKKPWWKVLWLLFVPLLIIFLSGCIDMELDITINSNSSGKAIITIAATDPFYNGFVDEFIEDIRHKDPQAKVKESYRGLNKVAEITLSFQEVSELSEQGFYIYHNHYEDKHYVEIGEIDGVPVKITLNMPGRIISSNGNSFGSRVTWEQAYMSEPYWAESEENGAGSITIILMAIFAILTISTIWYFRSRKSGAVMLNTDKNKPGGYCGNCGAQVEQSEQFCANCGSHQGDTEPSVQFKRDLFNKSTYPVLPLIIAILILSGITIVIILGGYFNDQADVKTDLSDIDESFIEVCDGWLMGGANITNSYFNASEKELSPPFRIAKAINIPTGFIGEDITLDDNAFYVSGSHSGDDNAVYKFDRITGELLWKFIMTDAAGGCSCPVAITDQFVVCGGQQSQYLYILDKKTGELLKAEEILGPFGLYSQPPKVDKGIVYAYGGTSDGKLLSYDIREGNVLQEISTGSVQSELAIFNDYLIGGNAIINTLSINTVVYSKRTGDILWETEGKRGISITTNGKYIYTLIGESGSELDRIVAYNINTGIIKWEKQLSKHADFFSKLAVSDEYLAVGAYNRDLEESKLIIFNSMTGDLIDEVNFNGKITSLVIANGYVYFSTPTAIYCYGLESANIVEIETLYTNDIAISNGELVILTWDKILIFNNIDGEIIDDSILISEEPEPEDNEDFPEENESIPWDGGIYIGPLKNGVPHGYGEWSNSDGKTYFGDFIEGKMTGQGIMVFPGGEKYVGDFLDGKGHGQGKMTHPDGRNISGTWINGVYFEN